MVDSWEAAPIVQRGPTYPSPNFPQWLHLTKLLYQNQEIDVVVKCVHSSVALTHV